ncbi:hypothetical protein D9M71_169230 [compost metagenome]
MEVTTGDHVTFGGEHQRVVGHGVGFDHQHFGGLAELGQAGPHDLRLAAQGVGILDLIAVLVRVGNFAALAEQMTVGGSGIDLTTLATGGMNPRIERRTRAQYGFNGQAATGQGASEEVLAFKQAAQGECSGHLRTIEQCQAFLGRQGQGLQAGHSQRFGSLQPLPLVAGLAFAQQHQRHVRQRGQVAGSTDRTLERDVWIHLGVDQGNQRIDHFTTNARETTAQAVDLEHHDQAAQRVADRLADAGGMGQHQRALQVFQVGAGNAGGSQQAEPCVDAIRGAILGKNLLNASDAGFDRGPGAGIEGKRYRLLIDVTQLGKAQLARDKV